MKNYAIFATNKYQEKINILDTTLLIPDKPYFMLDELAEIIANKIPKEPNNSRGINCLSRKLIAKYQFNNSPQYLYRIKGLVPTSSLMPDDRKQLELMLVDLPEINHFMSTEEIDHFFDGYYQHLDRPAWEPEITMPADRQAMQIDYHSRVAKHCENYLLKVRDGTLRLLDKNLAFLSGKEATAYYQMIASVTKADAIKFLEALGLKASVESPSNCLNISNQVVQTNEVELIPLANNNDQEILHLDLEPRLGKENNCLNAFDQASPVVAVKAEPNLLDKNRGQEKRWTSDMLEEAEKFRELHGTKATAEKYNVTTARIRQLLPSKNLKREKLPEGDSAWHPQIKAQPLTPKINSISLLSEWPIGLTDSPLTP